MRSNTLKGQKVQEIDLSQSLIQITSLSSIGKSDKILLLVLIQFIKWKIYSPTIEVLCEASDMCKQTAYPRLDRLRELKFIDWVKVGRERRFSYLGIPAELMSEIDIETFESRIETESIEAKGFQVSEISKLIDRSRWLQPEKDSLIEIYNHYGAELNRKFSVKNPFGNANDLTKLRDLLKAIGDLENTKYVISHVMDNWSSLAQQWKLNPEDLPAPQILLGYTRNKAHNWLKSGRLSKYTPKEKRIKWIEKRLRVLVDNEAMAIVNDDYRSSYKKFFDIEEVEELILELEALGFARKPGEYE